MDGRFNEDGLALSANYADTMENVVKLSVPLLIDMHAGKNWAEAK